jgi:transcription factor E
LRLILGILGVKVHVDKEIKMAKTPKPKKTQKIKKKSDLISLQRPFKENKIKKDSLDIKKESLDIKNESNDYNLEDENVIQTSESVKKSIDSAKIIDVISNLVGNEVIDLVIELITQDDYSEFKLAEKLNQDVNVTRNMLYRLLEHNFVSFSRRKDKRKGWYIYYWTFNPNNIEQKRIYIIEKKLSDLSSKLSNEGNHDIFFICQNKCEKYDFDFAMEHEFKCQECGELLEQHDNTDFKQKTISQIEELKQVIIELKS